MKRVATFIVEKRVLILIIMLVLTAICAVLSLRVSVNTDMTKYLPDKSSMKKGIDVMEEEFPTVDDDYTMRVMFTGLHEGQAEAMQDTLAQIPYVKEVDYEAGSEDYNRESHTLYILHTGYDFGSKEQLSIEKTLEEQFSSHDMVYMLDTQSVTAITPFILFCALTLLLAVLFVMCESWVEPFLFLLAIGVAIVLNMGTNIFLGTISEITWSIASILQLVLSMDYSIILINRYRQELKTHDNKADAMKIALANAFSSIASSSVTTIVGLLVLVFMSFKIGMDLGLVLAKGVFFSMICVFAMLPALILGCDTWIRKTAKKVLHVKMDAVAAFSYKFRYGILGVFAVLLVGSYFLQNNAAIAYTLDEVDPIADVFPPVNTVLVLFDNQDEDTIARIADHIEDNEHVKSVTAVSTTLGKPYFASELAEELKTMGMDSDIELDASVLNILYYYYYRHGETGDVSAGDFLRFLENDVVDNEAFADQLDGEIRDNLDMLSVFSDRKELLTPKGAAEIASVFDITKEDILSMFVYYYGKHGGVDTGAMTLSQFVGFIQSEILPDEDFNSLIEEDMRDQIGMLATLTDKREILMPRRAGGAADTLGMDGGDMDLLYMYYFAQHGAVDGMTLTYPEFARTVGNITADKRFETFFDDDMRDEIDKMGIFADPARFQKPERSEELAGALGMEARMAQLLYMLYYADHGAVDSSRLSIPQFIAVLDKVLADDRFESAIDRDMRDQVDILRVFGNERRFMSLYSSREFADLLGVDRKMADLLYAYYYAQKTDVSVDPITIEEFVRFLKADIAGNVLFSSMMGSGQKQQIDMLYTFTNHATLLTSYTSAQLAQLLGGMGIERSMIDMVFSLYHSDGSETMTLRGFVDFLVDQVMVAGSPFATNFDDATKAQLKGLQTLMQYAQGGPYAAAQLAAFTGMDGATVEGVLMAENAVCGLCSGSDPACPQCGGSGYAMGLIDFLGVMVNDYGAAELASTHQMLSAAAAGQSFTAPELASIFGMDDATVGMLLALSAGGGSGANQRTMTLSAFIDFLLQNFSSSLGSSASDLQMLKTLKDASLASTALSYADMASLTGMDTGMIKPLYLYHMIRYDHFQGPGAVLYHLVDFIVSDMAGSGFGGDELSQLSVMKDLMDGVRRGDTYTPGSLAGLIGMEADMLKMLYAFHVNEHGDTSGWKLSLQVLVDYVLNDLATGEFGNSLGTDDLEGLKTARTLMQSTLSDRRFTPDGLAGLVDMEGDMLKVLYAYHQNQHGDTAGWKLSLQGLVNYLLNDLATNENFGDFLSGDTMKDLQMLSKVMDGALKGTQYTAGQLAKLLTMDEDMPTQLYLLNISRYGDTSEWRLPLETFIHFLDDEVLTDEDIASHIDLENADMLAAARRIVDAVVDGTSYSAAQMAELFDGMSEDLSADRVKLMYVYFFSRLDSDPEWTFTLYDLFHYLTDTVLNDPLFSDLFTSDIRATLLDAATDVEDGLAQLKGPDYSRMIISTTFPGESDDTYAFLASLIEQFDAGLKGNYYLVGSSPMNFEMSNSFDSEMSFITLLTAISIFIVVALTFRSLLIPAILVLVIQCGVYLTISVIGLQGYSIYYLALLIVQCILMGATIDYGILFTSYYKEKRDALGAKEALAAALNASIHTILTSGLIMILVTGILGALFENPTIGQICRTISVGALCATILIVFILPGILSVFDRWIHKQPKVRTVEPGDSPAASPHQKNELSIE